MILTIAIGRGRPAAHLTGPAVLSVVSYGLSVPGIEQYALAEASRLYGPDAQLKIVRTGRVYGTSIGSHKGKFYADVLVRCLNFAECWDYEPAADCAHVYPAKQPAASEYWDN